MRPAPPESLRRELVRRLAARAAPLAPLDTGIQPALRRIEGVRVVLFDIYGTLFVSGAGDIAAGSESARADALADAWRAADLPPLSGAEAAQQADRLAKLVRRDHEQARAAGADEPEVDILSLWRELLGDESDSGRAAVLAVEYEARANPAWPMPDLAPTLDGLRARGLRMGIVSNAQFYTPLLFEALTGRTPAGWGFEKELCAWSWQAGVAKPSTRLMDPLAARIREHAGVAPASVLMLGNDRLNDLRPAAALGFRTALFAGDRRSYRPRHGDPRCKGVEPDLVLTALPQLLAALA